MVRNLICIMGDKNPNGVYSSFAHAFAISATREEEIDKALDSVYDKYDNYPEMIAEVSILCKTPNELAFAAFTLGAYAEAHRSKQTEVA